MMGFLLADERLLIPVRAESNEVVGDAWLIVDHEYADYEAWLPFVRPLAGSEEVKAGSANEIARLLDLARLAHGAE